MEEVGRERAIVEGKKESVSGKDEIVDKREGTTSRDYTKWHTKSAGGGDY